MKYLITTFAISLFLIGCATNRNYTSRQITKYEKRIKRIYADSIEAVVVNQNNLNVKIHILDSFPFSSQLTTTLDSGVIVGNKCKKVSKYTNPKGKIFEYSSEGEACSGYQFKHKVGSCSGYEDVLHLYIDEKDLVEGVYTYREIFDMHIGGYELFYQFYYDPMTMQGAGGTFQNNGYWMNNNKNN